MQHTITRRPPHSVALDVNPFNVVIVYEDFETGKQAKRTYDFLVENLGHDCQFSNSMWKFDVLGIRKLHDLAVKDAVMADIIMISGHGQELPACVKTWLESCLEERSRSIALVALFECPREEAASLRATRAYLAGIARRCNMEFFCQPDERRPEEEKFAFAANPDWSGRTLSTLAGVVQRDVALPRWGINE